uniref:Rpn family recombination-promoting nuclease/putative transposase n=1 Tax=uncultured Thiodictyon sp. TaxID=1846217 RepID=UPI0025E825EC
MSRPPRPRRFRRAARSRRTPHDGSYKQIFSHPEMVEGLLRDFVAEDWLALIDFSTLERQNGSYVTDDLREREDDIIWRVRVAGDWLYVYLLLEFQSRVDPWMAVRVMVYTGLLYQDLIKCGAVPEGALLPPVFPLVLYNGTGRWTAARDIADLITPLPNALTSYRPQHRYHLIDEGRIGPDTLEQAGSVAAELVRLETLAKDGPAALRPILHRLTARLQGARYDSLRRALTVWFVRVLLRRVMPGENLPEIHELQ